MPGGPAGNLRQLVGNFRGTKCVKKFAPVGVRATLTSFRRVDLYRAYLYSAGVEVMSNVLGPL